MDGEMTKFHAEVHVKPLREVERDYVLDVLRHFEGNRSKAAVALGVDRRTLYRMIDRYRLEGAAVPGAAPPSRASLFVAEPEAMCVSPTSSR